MSIRLRTAAFALLLAAPAITACAAEPTAPVTVRKMEVNADVGDTTTRKPTISWN